MTRAFVNWLTALAFILFTAAAGLFFIFFYYGRGLPDYAYLESYEPSALNSISTGNGKVLRIFARERRIFLPLSYIPSRVINSFLLAEDKNFYYHCGLDIQGILRAAITNSTQGAWQSRPLGGSTITQQVAKNFLVGNKRSFDRKIREAIMSLRLEFALGKQRILELYLNQIYLGMGAYGVAAAAQAYFGKPLEKLSIAQIAFLAALPKAPSFYPSQKELIRGKDRRDWVLDRLYEDGFLSLEELETALAEPLVILQEKNEKSRPDYYTEYIRQNLINRFGEKYVAQGGLNIKTTMDSVLQAHAEKSLRDGLIAYDRRHGYRGPVSHIDLSDNDNWVQTLQNSPVPPGMGTWLPAVVLEVSAAGIKIGLKDATQKFISLKKMAWARKTLPNQLLGSEITHPKAIFEAGDIIIVSRDRDAAWSLEQIPNVTGGIVVLNVHTGRVLAMVGGYDFEINQFNCATQAMRQPGSAFKPFVYLTALEQGYTPETPILDAPVFVNVGGKMGIYAPKNINNKYFGPAPLKHGLVYSRNVMTIRLAQKIGLGKIEKTAKNFDIVNNLPHQLAMALGVAETTLLRLTNAYAMIANGGYRTSPVFIDRIKDRYDQIIYDSSLPQFAHSGKTGDSLEQNNNPDNEFADNLFLASAHSIDQLTGMMEGVVQKGTARSLLSLNRPVAGKTGTTNDYKDGWFIGFTPDIVVGVFVGFASPRTLGAGESGARVAVPIFKQFMEEAMKDAPVKSFR